MERSFAGLASSGPNLLLRMAPWRRFFSQWPHTGMQQDRAKFLHRLLEFAKPVASVDDGRVECSFQTMAILARAFKTKVKLFVQWPWNCMQARYRMSLIDGKRSSPYMHCRFLASFQFFSCCGLLRVPAAQARTFSESPCSLVRWCLCRFFNMVCSGCLPYWQYYASRSL